MNEGVEQRLEQHKVTERSLRRRNESLQEELETALHFFNKDYAGKGKVEAKPCA